MIVPGLTPCRSSDGVSASTRTSGSQPPTARHSVLIMFILASARSAAACAVTRSAISVRTWSCAPQAMASRRPARAAATESAIASSPTTDLSCRVARDGSRLQNSKKDTAIGMTVRGSTAGTSVARPTNALTVVNAKVRPTASSPAKLSLTISAWCVMRATAPVSARFAPCVACRSAPVTMRRTRSSRSGSTSAATLR